MSEDEESLSFYAGKTIKIYFKFRYIKYDA
jgi:hypothetical protein